MFLSSIDISFFTLPLVFHTMGFVLAAGFFFYLLFFGLMASQCYVELKKLSTIARKNNSSRDYVGLMDLIDECCSQESTRFMNPHMLYLVEMYLKIVVVSTLVMLQACNQCFISVIIQRSFSGYFTGSAVQEIEEGTSWSHSVPLLVAILSCVWIAGPLVKHTNVS